MGFLGCSSPAEEGDPAGDDDVEVPALDPFSLILIPDIQYVTLAYPDVLDAMTGWAAAERDDRDIRFVLQEGDLTHENTDAEWGAPPPPVAPREGAGPHPHPHGGGGHDMGEGGDTTRFNETFPVSRFEAAGGLGGTRVADRMDDAYFRFEAGRTPWLILSLTYAPDDEALAWASGVAGDHPDHRVIVLTHAYLAPNGELSGTGQDIWDQLVSRHANMTLVLNGHYIDGEAAQRISEGDAGNTVVQLFANYQDRPFGGAGLLRILELDPANGELAVSTYSPWLDFWESDDANEFVLEGLDLGPLDP